MGAPQSHSFPFWLGQDRKTDGEGETAPRREGSSLFDMSKQGSLRTSASLTEVLNEKAMKSPVHQYVPGPSRGVLSGGP